MMNPFTPMLCMAPDTGGAGAGDAEEKERLRDEQTAGEKAAAEGDTEREQESEAETTGSDAIETLKAQYEALDARYHELEAKMEESLLRTAAALSGVPRERIAYVVRMANAGEIDVMADDAAKQCMTAVEKVLADVPELLGGGMSTGSSGNHARRTQNTADAQAVDRIRENILGASAKR